MLFLLMFRRNQSVHTVSSTLSLLVSKVIFQVTFVLVPHGISFYICVAEIQKLFIKQMKTT